MKIDPYNYPLIIITAFVVGMILAMVFGFRPEHGSTNSNGHGHLLPAQTLTVQLWEAPTA